MNVSRKLKARIAIVVISCALLPILIPAGIFLAIYLTSPMNPLNDWMFNRDLPEYNHVIADIKAGNIKTSHVVEKVDIAKIGYSAGRAIGVYAASCNNGTVTVAFLIHGASVGHWGYAFDDCDMPSVSLINHNSLFEHAGISPMRDHWYMFSN